MQNCNLQSHLTTSRSSARTPTRTTRPRGHPYLSQKHPAVHPCYLLERRSRDLSQASEWGGMSGNAPTRHETDVTAVFGRYPVLIHARKDVATPTYLLQSLP